MRKVTYQIKREDAGVSIERYLQKIQGFSRAQVRSLKFRPEGICCNGNRVRVTQMLKEGDTLELLIQEEREGSLHLISADSIPSILYEDEDLLVVDKPPLLAVHPAHGHFTDSLANQVANYCRKSEQNFTIRPIGRLDLETSGVVLFAKNKLAAGILSRERESGVMQKEYLAICKGIFKEETGIIQEPIGPVPGELMKMEVRSDGKEAYTKYQVEKQFEKERCARVRVKLRTGRTHQIRVHMAWLGHPLLGDRIYGDGKEDTRAALHAERLSFTHPFTKKVMTIISPVPNDMRNFLPLFYKKKK